jgi:GAF domain-containing protein
VVTDEQDGPVRQAVNSTGQSADPGTARRLSELARELQADITAEALLKHIARAAVTEVAGARHAAITLVAGKTFATAGVSDELAARIDQIQYETGEGPCLDAAREHKTVRCDDLRADARWPRFASHAVKLGVRSVLSVQLFAGNDSFGALNLYGRDPAAFGSDSESTGILLASHAALAMSAARTQTGLLTAMDSREMIGQAKGILIERYKITGVEAFGLLVVSSQAVNRKLRDVAEHLVATGELLTPSR